MRDRAHGSRVRGLVIAAALLAAPSPALAVTANRIVAIVNDEVITDADIAAYMRSLVQEGEPLPDGEEGAGMRRQVLVRLVEQRLMLQEARRAGVAATSDEVQRRLAAVRGRIGASEEAFRESLAASGITMEQMQERVREQILVQRVIAHKVRAGITVSPHEVARAIAANPELSKPGDRVRASHILIRVTDTRSADDAKAAAARIREQIVEGKAEFAELARQHSDDASKDAGGAMGWVAPGELLPSLDAALFALPAGEVSQPIETKLGVHILKTEERRSAASLNLLEANQAVERQLFDQKFNAAMAKWLEELKRKAYLELVES